MQFGRTNRRQFIKLLGGTAVSAPPARGGGQQPERIRRIGVLMFLPAGDRRTFQQALERLGWRIGHNVQIDVRWGAGGGVAARNGAAELLAQTPDVVLAAASSPAALLEATRTMPIVFVNFTDPVGAGYVGSLSQPGGNATGFQ